MNILILNWRDPDHPNSGGAEQATLEHAKYWIKKGHKVWWFSSVFENCKKIETKNNISFIRSGHQLMGVQINAFIWYLFKNKTKFDLVIDQVHGIPFFTPLYVREKKLAFIHEVAKEVWWHNHLPLIYKYIVAFAGWLTEPLIYLLIYTSIPFMTVSESTKNDLVKWGIPPKNVTVIKNGITLPSKKIQIKKDEVTTIMYLGAHAKDKGTEDAIKVFSILKSKHPNWKFWLAGKGHPFYVKDLKALAKKLKIKNIKFWGFVDENKKFELLSKAKVLVNPSMREGWGLVNLEASYMGTPVVGYKVPGTKDSVKDGNTGLLCANKTPSCLASKVEKIISDKSTYKKMSSNSRKWASEHTWKKSTKKSLELIERLVI